VRNCDVGEFDLLQKTELKIQQIALRGANLNDVAAVVAEMIGIERDEVVVTDVFNDTMRIDILRKSLDIYSLIGKGKRLLLKLAQLPGVGVSAETSFCSEGMLGGFRLIAPMQGKH